MEPVKKIIEKASVPLVVDIPEEYKDRKVEVTVKPLDEPVEGFEKENDLLEFYGKMKWEGDALAEQKKLRNEWE